MMHVLSVAYPFAPVSPDTAGGAEQILSAIDLALVAAGHRSTVIACDGSRVAGRLLAHRLPPDVIDDSARARVHAVVRQHIAQALAHGDVDVVHLHGVDFMSYLPPAGPPCLVTLHLPISWYPDGAVAPSRPATWVHCVSWHQHRTCPPSPAMLPPIPNGVPVEALAAHHHARRGFALVLGRICPEKGQHIALESAQLTRVPLLLAGEVFPYPAHQDYFAREIAPRLDARARWLGPVGFARKRRLLSAARCVLVPSLAPETASLVAMEALACGTPVVAFPSGALSELIEPGRTGFLVRNAAEMADAIHHVGEIDPAYCRAIAHARFSIERMTAAYLERYAALARAAVAAA